MDTPHEPHVEQGLSAATGSTRVPTMRALVQERYGPPEVLRMATVDTPVPGPDEVLVRVEAAAINARDWHVMRGEPRLARLLDATVFGLRRPRVRTRGTDFAGVVEAVGTEVDAWRPGDAVFGEADATLAQRVTAAQDAVAAVPDGVTFEQAAAIPLAGATAMLCLAVADPQPRQRVVINGASGGVGTFAVQLAKYLGLHVTAVCSARNGDLARSLGADAVIDYNSDDFCSTGDAYDVVVDLVGNRSLRDLRRTTRPGGTVVLSGGGVSGQGRLIGPLALLVRAQISARLRRGRLLTPQAKPERVVLARLGQLVSDGVVSPAVDRTYPFEDAAAALRYLDSEHASAKVVINRYSS